MTEAEERIASLAREIAEAAMKPVTDAAKKISEAALESVRLRFLSHRKDLN